ncbi:exopolysaccharide Pel transporter PelG [Cytobacillus sp. Hm23]
MAGIGFQLKKLFNEQGILNQVKAYSYSTIVTVGPLALCILLLTFAQQLLIYADTPFVEREKFLAAAQYALIFSQIITGGFNLIISRYVADHIFLKKYDYILSSMYGVICICVTIGAVSAFLFYLFSPMNFTFKVVSYIFFVELIIIWIQCMYVSALKDYMKIVRSFVVGVVVSIALICICIYVLKIYSATAMFICLDIGFAIMIIRFTQYIRAFFHVNNEKYFLFFSYMRLYPYLFVCGLLYTLGLYGHNLIIWHSKVQYTVEETFTVAPYYDVPVFFAYLSVLPAMVLFVVSLETSFYKTYRSYYDRILNSFPLKDILSAKKTMFKTLSLELTFITEIQLLVVICSIALGLKYLPTLGFTFEQMHIFTILVLGNLFFIIMYTVVLILLYFDDQKGACLTTVVYTVGSMVLTAVLIRYDIYGYAVFIVACGALIFGLWKLTSYLNNIDYYTFCSQPILNKEKPKKVGNLFKRMRKQYE